MKVGLWCLNFATRNSRISPFPVEETEEWKGIGDGVPWPCLTTMTHGALGSWGTGEGMVVTGWHEPCGGHPLPLQSSAR